MLNAMLAWSPFDPWHLLVIGIVALLLFGKRLPEVGRSLGRGIMEFKRGLREVHDDIDRADTEERRRELDSKRETLPRDRVQAGAADRVE